MQNALVAEAFDEIASLMELAGENPFKIRAYKRAAEAIASLEEPIEEVAEAGRLRGIDGLGEATAAKTAEFLATGSMKVLAALREAHPPGLLDVLRVPGLGPKKVAALHKERGISSLEELKRALDSGELAGLSGFGPKAIANLKVSIARLATLSRRLPLGEARALAATLQRAMGASSTCERVEVVGSVRRGCETAGDINLVATSQNPQAALDAFASLPSVLAVEERGASRASAKVRGGVVARLEVTQSGLGEKIFAATGSASHIEGARLRAEALGLAWPQVLEGARDDEAGIYKALGVPFIAPELREGRGEWEAAEKNELPKLVEVADIRGDLHAHSTWSDGVATIEEMATALAARGSAFYAVSDPSKALAMANGLDARRLREQAREIVEVQAKFPGLKILRSVECDILRDGSLDLDDEILHELDFVIASVHSAFTLGEAAQTERMVRAISHPAVDMVAHPTGRILGARAGYDVNVAALIEAAKEHGKALEINASERLDLSDEHARAAREAGVPLCVNTDAHSVRMLPNIELGVLTARRAWCEPRNVLNTWPLEELLKWLKH